MDERRSRDQGSVALRSVTALRVRGSPPRSRLPCRRRSADGPDRNPDAGAAKVTSARRSRLRRRARFRRHHRCSSGRLDARPRTGSPHPPCRMKETCQAPAAAQGDAVTNNAVPVHCCLALPLRCRLDQQARSQDRAACQVDACPLPLPLSRSRRSSVGASRATTAPAVCSIPFSRPGSRCRADRSGPCVGRGCCDCSAQRGIDPSSR